MLRRFLFLPFLLSAGCFVAGTTGAPDGGDTSDGGSATDAVGETGSDVLGPDVITVTSETWQDGKHIASSVVILGGATVTIAPGASITVAAGAVIRVEGSLAAQSAQGAHAKITGTGWGGIQVVNYGMMALDGVDLAGANVALDMQAEAPCKYDHGTISAATTPFSISAGGNLSTTHGAVTVPNGISRVGGALTASYLDYDANDHGAILTTGASAFVFIEDSTFHNSGPLAGKAPDLLTTNGAQSLHVAYSDLSGAHCGFHFDAVTSVDIDHVTVHDVANGADVWGSSTSSGSRTVTSSNFESLTENFDESGTNGPLSVSGSFLTGTNKLKDGMVQITSPASQAIPDAKPR